MKVREECGKAGLKLGIQKTKSMASGHINLWQIEREKLETVTDFIFLGSKITVDGDWSHEIKRCLLLGRKAMTNLDSVLKSKDITLPTKVRLVKAMVFLVVMYGCESWTIKKAERWRILNCGSREGSWESHGLQRDQISQSHRESVLSIHYKDWRWRSNTLVTGCEGPTYLCWERLKAGGKGENRG